MSTAIPHSKYAITGEIRTGIGSMSERVCLMNETNHLPMWGPLGRYYMRGVMCLREDNGGDRHTLSHCFNTVEVWYHSDNTDRRFYAKCHQCKSHWEASRAEELWQMIATPSQE